MNIFENFVILCKKRGKGCVAIAGKLIVLEGLDGSGKSTQLDLLQAHLLAERIPCRTIKLPNYEGAACAPVKMYLNGQFGDRPEDVNAYAASTFYAVDRYASYRLDWQPDYEAGKVLIADRYASSNLYHQATKLPPEEWDSFMQWCGDFEYGKLGIPQPDLVVYLDMPIAYSQSLLAKRYQGDSSKKDIHERDIAYLQQCRQAARFAAEKLGWVWVPCMQGDAALSREALHAVIYKHVEQML